MQRQKRRKLPGDPLGNRQDQVRARKDVRRYQEVRHRQRNQALQPELPQRVVHDPSGPPPGRDERMPRLHEPIDRELASRQRVPLAYQAHESLVEQTLVEGTEKSQVVELGGPAYSMNDAAVALSAITGKPIAVHEAPLEAMVPTLTGFGLPQEVAGMFREMTEGLLRGHVAFEGGHRRVQGTTSLETVLRALLAPKG